MKKTLLFSIAISCLSIGLSLKAQDETWENAVSRVSDNGDTVVIKPVNDGGCTNSVFVAIMGDTNSTGARNNVNRIYKTVRGGYYYYSGPANFDLTVPNIVIVADDGDNQPPLHVKTVNSTGGITKGMFNLPGNMYLKNQYLSLVATSDATDRMMFNMQGEDQTLEFDNCTFEVTNWTMVSDFVSGLSFKATNCYFLNIGREPSLEKGCVLDGTGSLRSVYLENNTFFNIGCAIMNRYQAGTADFYANHNTFVNNTQNPFHFYTQATEIVTNNLFINTGLIPMYDGFYAILEEEDDLARGIINIDTVESAWKTDYYLFDYPVATEAERKILVDRNNAWWDNTFNTMFTSQLATAADGKTWLDQKITMNSRTKAMFDDATSYPYFTEGEWFNADPGFVKSNSTVLVPAWVSYIVTNADPSNLNGGDAIPSWRTNNSENLVLVDWPVLADLSYTNDELLTAGLNKFPLGDLNWFPAYKSQWETTKEYDTLIAYRNRGAVPSDYSIADTNVSGISHSKINLSNDLEVFPNPANGSVTVKFKLEKAGDVQFVVYSNIGKEIQVIHQSFSSGENEYQLNISNLQPGAYILKLNINSTNTVSLSRLLVY